MGISAKPTVAGPKRPVACHVSGTRKSTPYIPNVIAPAPQTAPAKPPLRNMSRGTRAAAPRKCSTIRNPANATAAIPNATMPSTSSPPSCASMAAHVRPPRARIDRI